MSGDKFEPQTFTMYKHEKARRAEIERVAMLLGGLPLDSVYTVKVKKGEEGRREIANRLYQVAIGQVARQGYEDGDVSVIAGKSKFHLLLPQKTVWANEFQDDALLSEATLENDLCDMIASSPVIEGDDLFRAYDRAIRSSTLKVKPFALYLDRFLDVWARKGVGFSLKPSERARAIGGMEIQQKEAQDD